MGSIAVSSTGELVGTRVGANDGTFERVQVGNVQVGNKDGRFMGTFVGTSVSEAIVRVSVVGALVGALVGAEVGSGAKTKITGGFLRGIKHWRAVKATELKITADDPTIKRARMATERNMVITASPNKFILYLENKTFKVQYFGFRLSLLRNNERR